MDFMNYLGLAWKVGGRYFFFAGIAYLLYYVVWKKNFSKNKIQLRYPKPADYRREIGFSVLTILIFSAVPFIMLNNDSIRVHTTYYKDIHQHGLLYFYLAFPIMFFMHDTYFYWMHRLMHHPKLFKTFHLLHHRSVNPSPWAAYAFHPLEAIVEVGIVVIFLFTIPIHLLHLGLFFIFMIIYNVYGHLGWELYPKKFSRNRIGKWINTSVSHNQHHQHFKGNYGLYTLTWDRWMGTIRKDYETKFEEVKKKQTGLVQNVESKPRAGKESAAALFIEGKPM